MVLCTHDPLLPNWFAEQISTGEFSDCVCLAPISKQRFLFRCNEQYLRNT